MSNLCSSGSLCICQDLSRITPMLDLKARGKQRTRDLLQSVGGERGKDACRSKAQ